MVLVFTSFGDSEFCIKLFRQKANDKKTQCQTGKKARDKIMDKG